MKIWEAASLIVKAFLARGHPGLALVALGIIAIVAVGLAAAPIAAILLLR